MPTVLGIKNGSSEATYTVKKVQGIAIVVKTFSNVYYVLSDTVNDNEDTIVLTTGIPQLFSPLNGAYCKKQSPKHITRVVHPVTGVPADKWEVKCDFDTETDEEEKDKPPESQRPEEEWSSVLEDERIYTDPVNNKAIQTKNQEPLIYHAPRTKQVLEISRIELGPFNDDVISRFAGKANSRRFRGHRKNTVVLEEIRTSPEQIIRVSRNLVRRYVPTVYRLKFNFRTWEEEILHHGYLYRKVAGGQPELYKDPQGNPHTVNLRIADGTKVPLDMPAEYLKVNRYELEDLNLLNLGPF